MATLLRWQASASDQPSQRAQHQAMIVQRRRQRAREPGPRLSFDQLGAERDILALAGFRLGEPAEPLQDRAMIAQSRREMARGQEMVGQPRPRLGRRQPAPDRDILALAGFGLGEPAEGLQHQAEMRQRRGEGLCQLGAALAFDGLAQSLGAEAQDRFRPPPALGLEEAAAIGGQRQQSANAPLGRDRSGRGGSGFSGAGLMSEHEAGVVEIGLVVDPERIPMPGMAVLDHRGDAAVRRCEERCQDGITRDVGGELVMGDAVARPGIAVVHPIVPRPAPHLLDDIGKLEEDAAQAVAAQAPALDLIDRDRGLRRAEEQEQRPVDTLIERVADALPQRLEIGRIEAVGRGQLVNLSQGGRHQGGGPQGLDQMRQIAEGAARLLHHPAGKRFAPEMRGQPRHGIAGQQRAVFGRRGLQAQRPITPLAARGAERADPPGDALAQGGSAGQQDQAARWQIARGNQEVGERELPVVVGGQFVQSIQDEDQPRRAIGLHERGQEFPELRPQAIGRLVLALDLLDARAELFPRLIGQKHDEIAVVGPFARQNVIEQRRHAAALAGFLLHRPGDEALAGACRPLEMDVAGPDFAGRLPQPIHDPVGPQIFGRETPEQQPLALADGLLVEGAALPSL